MLRHGPPERARCALRPPAPRLLRALLGPRQASPLRGSAELCGKVTREAAAATGLREGTPVAGGLFDIDACALATGLTDPGLLCLIAGSWSINEYIAAAPVDSRTFS